VVTRTRALNVRVGLVRSSRCFGRNEELDVSRRAMEAADGTQPAEISRVAVRLPPF
jgi:hypothetical protein